MDDSMEIVDLKELLSCLGGQGSPSNDCVLNCYDYIDDGSLNAGSYYAYIAEYYCEYTNDSAGLKTEYIDDLGNYAGMAVNELTGSFSFNGSNGRLPNGDQIMMTFNSTEGADHAVVVTGAVQNSGGSWDILYYDPTTGDTGKRASGSYSGMYGVGPVGSYTGS
ncbi:MAG: hypothetical protein M5Z89_23900 [Olivibacter sp.]|nr:hypothetical protein [Olivibacter sp. UJ_SKK_5.1]